MARPGTSGACTTTSICSTRRLARSLDLGSDVITQLSLGRPGVRLAAKLTDTASFVRGYGSFLEFTM
jgi:hypothetical protein